VLKTICRNFLTSNGRIQHDRLLHDMDLMGSLPLPFPPGKGKGEGKEKGLPQM